MQIVGLFLVSPMCSLDATVQSGDRTGRQTGALRSWPRSVSGWSPVALARRRAQHRFRARGFRPSRLL